MHGNDIYSWKGNVIIRSLNSSDLHSGSDWVGMQIRCVEEIGITSPVYTSKLFPSGVLFGIPILI